MTNFTIVLLINFYSFTIPKRVTNPVNASPTRTIFIGFVLAIDDFSVNLLFLS